MAEREQHALQKIDGHPSIVRFHGVCQDAGSCYIMLKSCHQTLAQLVASRGRLVDADGRPDDICRKASAAPFFTRPLHLPCPGSQRNITLLSICFDYGTGDRQTADIGPHDKCHKVTGPPIALPPDEYRLCSMRNSCLLHKRVLCAIIVSAIVCSTWYVNSRHTMPCSIIEPRLTRS